MKKKQMLATLVMLSLLQGSVYAAEDIVGTGDGIYLSAGQSVGSITFDDVDVDDYAVTGNSFSVEGGISFIGSDINNKATFGDKLLDFTSNSQNSSIKISGNIIIKNATGKESGFIVNGNGKYSGTASVNSISVENLILSAQNPVSGGPVKDADAVEFTNGVHFKVNDISVNNITFTGNEVNNITGINITSAESISNDDVINSLTATNIKSEATTDSNGFLAGIQLSNTIMPGGVNTIKVSDVNGTNLSTNGLLVTEQDLKANSVDVRKVASKNEIAYGMKLTSGYDSTETGSNIEKVYIEDVSSEKGMAVGGAVTKGSKEQNANINSFEVNNVKSTDNWSLGIWTNKSYLNSGYLSATDVASVNSDAYGLYSQESGNIEADTAYIGKVSSDNGVALGLYINGGSEANFKNLQVEQVNSVNKFAAAVNVRNSTLNSDNAFINLPDNEDNYGDYTGFYNGVATDKATNINNIALRSIAGSDVNWTNSEGNYLVYGSIVAGAGSKGAKGGVIDIGGASTQIYGDVFAGNGGQVNITLNGTNSVLEGQVDDYHELANADMADNVFHNSAFMDSNGNELDVTSAGKATLNINDGGQWFARGQSFVDTVTLNGGTIDMSKNENSSVTVNDLSGSGKVKMRLNTGDREQSDMLYVTGSLEGNYELQIAGNEFDINEITEDNPLRFATVKGDVNTANIKARTVDAGFFNNEYTITKENFTAGDEENIIYNNSGVLTEMIPTC